ncbi:hypothetical protein Tco_0885503 [Tanacetum coccineum]
MVEAKALPPTMLRVVVKSLIIPFLPESVLLESNHKRSGTLFVMTNLKELWLNMVSPIDYRLLPRLKRVGSKLKSRSEYKLVYGKACHLPVELEHKSYWVLKHANFDLKTADDHRKLQLNELSELRDQAYENSLIYKEKTKKLHDSKIKNRIFNVGDQVLLFNSRLKIFSGKLKSRWSGPFTITEVYPYGTAKLSNADGSNFKVNCHRLKHYYGGDTPPLVIPDLQTFPKDN